MTIAKILEQVCVIHAHLKGNDTVSAFLACDALVADLQAEINAQEAAKDGKKEAQAAAVRILKTAEKTGQDKLTKALTATDGSQLISDGYRLVKLATPLPLPQYAAGEERELVGRLENFLANASENCGAGITPPSISELRNPIAIAKAEAKINRTKLPYVQYLLGDGLYVDALLLLDILQIFPDAVLIPSVVQRATRPIYIKSAHGSGLLCPLRVTDK